MSQTPANTTPDMARTRTNAQNIDEDSAGSRDVSRAFIPNHNFLARLGANRRPRHPPKIIEVAGRSVLDVRDCRESVSVCREKYKKLVKHAVQVIDIQGFCVV